MSQVDHVLAKRILERLAIQSASNDLRITAHAHQEMIEENISIDDVISVLAVATVVENYPDHRRGPCCLVSGRNKTGRELHVVCTTSLDLVIVITVYEPKPPKWLNSSTRGNAK